MTDDEEQIKFLNDPERVRAQMEWEKNAALVVVGVIIIALLCIFPALLSVPLWFVSLLFGFAGFVGWSQQTLAGRDVAGCMAVAAYFFAVAYHVAW